jgi:hypothetical protein
MNYLWPPIGRRSLLGIDIIEAPTYPNYELPKEVIPGVPWPKGFREDFMKWSKEFLGYNCAVPLNVVYFLGTNKAIADPRTVAKLIHCAI